MLPGSRLHFVSYKANDHRCNFWNTGTPKTYKKAQVFYQLQEVYSVGVDAGSRRLQLSSSPGSSGHVSS